MDVVALLPDRLLDHLRLVLGSAHALTVAAEWTAVEEVLGARMVDVLVVDPAVMGSALIGALQQVRRRYPSVPVLVYTTLSARTMHTVVQLARAGVDEVVLHRFDDEPARFRALLEQVPAQALVEQLLRALAEPLAALPLPLVAAVEQMLRMPERFRTTHDLASAAGMHPRTLYRALHVAGLPSARLLVLAPRLLRAYVHLRDPGRSIKAIAERTGYHSAWQLTQQMRVMTGFTPSWVRRRVTPEAFVMLVADRLRHAARRPGDTLVPPAAAQLADAAEPPRPRRRSARDGR